METTRLSKTGCVLLLGNDDRVLLATARSLGRKGVVCDVAWCDPKSPALKSRYVRQFHVLPDYDSASDHWISALNRLVSTGRYNLVIPVNDYACVPLQHNRHLLSEDARFYLISPKAFETANDKAAMSSFVKKLGVNVPAQVIFDNAFSPSDESQREEVLRACDALKFPLYVKPKSSVVAESVDEKRSVARAQSAEDIFTHISSPALTDGFILQSEFDGVGVGVEFLAKDGDIQLLLQHRRLRETIDGGSTYRETAIENEKLTEAAEKILSALKYSGVGMLEFRYNDASNEWVFLELNARFWGSLPLAVAAGVDFPYALYRSVMFGDDYSARDYPVGTRCRNLRADYRAFRRQRQPGDRYGWRSLFGKNEHLDFYAKDDRRPFFYLFTAFVKKNVGKALRR